MRINDLAYVLLLAVGGCEKTDPLFCTMNPGATGCPMPDGDVVDDTADEIDASPDVPSRLCYGAAAYAFCLAMPAIDAVMFTATTSFDTSTSNPQCRTAPTDWINLGQPDACFLVGTVVQMPTLNVTGPRPLVIVSASTIEITGSLDVAGHRQDTGNKAGPGANLMCNAGTAPTGDVDGGGGGAGGSFMGTAGDGGDGGGLNNNGSAGNGETQAPTRLRGGCHGQAGGFGHGNGGAGALGFGGGGLYLVAATEIRLAAGASINASGGGGGRPGREGGAGGGGSGGMIVLNAMSVVAQPGSFIVANGAGGGGGADSSGGASNGAAGEETDPSMPDVVAAGGNGAGGDGGAGAIDAAVAQGGMSAAAMFGGGGGGGSKGYIVSNKSIANVATSPTLVVVTDP